LKFSFGKGCFAMTAMTEKTAKKVALITGGNKGLGLEIARQLAAKDIVVVIGARNATSGEEAVKTLRECGADAHWVKLEVTSAEDVAALPDYFEKNFGRLDILVNNAGVLDDLKNSTPASVIEDLEIDVMRRTFEVNVIAPFAIQKALLPLLKASPAGRIVNQSSILGSIATVSAGQAGDFADCGDCS
jgi:NAD(P)-dependent dehydrogenase (short-subunit alcohol dehydrogenase family)